MASPTRNIVPYMTIPFPFPFPFPFPIPIPGLQSSPPANPSRAYWSLSESSLNAAACLLIPAINTAMSLPAIAYRMHACLLANVSMRSGRGSSPPRPTKTRRPSTDALSAAAAILAMVEWKSSPSYSCGIPSLRGRRRCQRAAALSGKGEREEGKDESGVCQQDVKGLARGCVRLQDWMGSQGQLTPCRGRRSR
jgi:hypothetical protein